MAEMEGHSSTSRVEIKRDSGTETKSSGTDVPSGTESKDALDDTKSKAKVGGVVSGGKLALGKKRKCSESVKVSSVGKEEEEDEEFGWDDFTAAEMKVLVQEVELRKEALFGEYKEGESPKYRWLFWQEVAEKVNEVNPCIHRNLEQVRIKWFDYKDPSNKWESRVRQRAYKHTTGMFFKRRMETGDDATGRTDIISRRSDGWRGRPRTKDRTGMDKPRLRAPASEV
ncbi:uncharacterized protein [Hetaerina americana]|uniref:uncharacterized protein n=1 Tax=Hetaerina americana TaxID=62018 RepID=UPI003A7F2E46